MDEPGLPYPVYEPWGAHPLLPGERDIFDPRPDARLSTEEEQRDAVSYLKDLYRMRLLRARDASQEALNEFLGGKKVSVRGCFKLYVERKYQKIARLHKAGFVHLFKKEKRQFELMLFPEGHPDGSE